ncbi:hypothetical protein HanIR_Chr08g0371001 [Helianthus annuus]|nr:hypothetical protein HanIR_Chr08g0371001 [Helianthus annuus]
MPSGKHSCPQHTILPPPMSPPSDSQPTPLLGHPFDNSPFDELNILASISLSTLSSFPLLQNTQTHDNSHSLHSVSSLCCFVFQFLLLRLLQVFSVISPAPSSDSLHRRRPFCK